MSLTTYGPRTAGTFLTIEAIGIGKLRPRRMILWIDEPEVIAHPPAQLRRLVKRGLEIRPCENIGPHKKYYPYAQELAGDHALMVTADDDVFYPRWWLRRLVDSYFTTPGDVVAHRVWAMRRSADGYAPYNEWSLCSSVESSFYNFATGVSGVLYDQAMLALMRQHGDRFKKVCPRADDIWLHFVAVSSGIKIRQVANEAAEFWPRLKTTEYALAHENTTGGGNDVALAMTAQLFAQRTGASVRTTRSLWDTVHDKR